MRRNSLVAPMDSITLDRNEADVAVSADLDRGLCARARGDRIGALAHFRAASAAEPSRRLEMEIAREEEALGLR